MRIAFIAAKRAEHRGTIAPSMLRAAIAVVVCGCGRTSKKTGNPSAKSACGVWMLDEQIYGRVPKRFKQTTNSDHADPIAANVLARDFTAAAPNQRWVSYTTLATQRSA
jgi:hypothetical protein